MKAIHYVWIYLLVFSGITASAQLNKMHIGTPNAYEYGNSLTVLPDGSSLVCAVQYQSIQSSDLNAGDALILKVSPINQLLWAKKLSTGRRDKFTKAVVDANGNIYACGYTDMEFNSANGEGFVIKMDADGNIIWERKFPNPGYGTMINDMIILSNGNLALVGSSSTWYNASDGLLIVLQPDGQLVYGRSYDLAFNGSPTNGDLLGKIAEYNGKIFAGGAGRGAGSEYQNVFTLEIDPADGSITHCREYEYTFHINSGSFPNSYLIDFFIRDGHIILSSINLAGFTILPGSVMGILDIDIDNNYSTTVGRVAQGYNPHTSFGCIYPLSGNEYFSSYIVDVRALSPEQDNSGFFTTRTSFNRIRSQSFILGKFNETDGINGLNAMDINASKTTLSGIGMSEKSDNQIGLQDILLMKTDLNLTPGTGCSVADDTAGGLFFTYFTPKIISPPSDSFKQISSSSLPISPMPVNGSTAFSPDTLSIRKLCHCYRDSTVSDSFCKGSTYILRNGQTTNIAGRFLVDTIAYKDECSVKLYAQISVYSGPDIEAGNDISICIGDSISLHATGTGSLSWNNGIQNDRLFLPQNSFTALVTAIDKNNCQSKDSILVTVHQLPLVDAGTLRPACYNTLITLSGNGASTYQWDHGVSNNMPFRFTQTTTYTVTGTDRYGCQNTDSIKVEPDTSGHTFFPPNSFSPNNDLYNDIYAPGGDGFELLYMAVYNRWGALIYENNTNDVPGWDGRYKGEIVPEGIYLVKFEYRFCAQYVEYKNMTITIVR